MLGEKLHVSKQLQYRISDLPEILCVNQQWYSYIIMRNPRCDSMERILEMETNCLGFLHNSFCAICVDHVQSNPRKLVGEILFRVILTLEDQASSVRHQLQTHHNMVLRFSRQMTRNRPFVGGFKIFMLSSCCFIFRPSICRLF